MVVDRDVMTVEFNQVLDKLERGDELTYEMLGDIFGKDLWILIVYSFLDSQDAARAIQGAIRSLKQEAQAEQVD